MLTPAQQSIPILILSTATSQELIYNKNNLSISELFTAIANSIGSSYSTTGSGSGSGSAASVSSGHTGIRLPPLRSVNSKSIQMKWDDLQFIFYNGRELDYGIGNDENTVCSSTDPSLSSASSSSSSSSSSPMNNTGGQKNYYVKNENMLGCAAREEWFGLDGDNGNNNNNNNSFRVKLKGATTGELTVEDIESHIDHLIQNGGDGTNSNSQSYPYSYGRTFGDDHNQNHKSQTTGKLTSWTELHENNEKVHEDPFVIQHTENARQANDNLIAKTNESPWLVRFRHVLNAISSSSCVSTPSSTGSGSAPSSAQKKPYYDSMLSCPPVILHIASSNDEHPIEALLEMKNSKMHLPNVCKNGFYDVNSMRKYFLILHDEVDGRVDFDEEKVLFDMSTRFGSTKSYSTSGGTLGSNRNCYGVVRLNSIPLDIAKSNASKEDPVWDIFIQNKQWPTKLSNFMQESVKVRGSCLSSKDKSSLRKFIAQMVATSVLPSIETRIHNMNVEVSNSKKGVKNVFKNFWRKPKESGNLNDSLHDGVIQGGASGNSSSHGPGLSSLSPQSDNVFYRYDSIESQTRLLADTLFIIKDYDSAFNIYRLVKDDYKHDQNAFHAASTHEMMALCLIMMDLHPDRSRGDIISHIEEAMELYRAASEIDPLMNGLDKNRPTVATLATRCLTRLAIMQASMPSLCMGRDERVAKELGNASSHETSLGAAVLLEQSSALYFQAGMYRKFAHHILMAGHLFRSAGQEQHALRCFASSMYIYHGNDRVWIELFDHVTSALAAQLYAMKRMKLSFELYKQLVATTGNGRVSIKSQQKFFDNVLKICRGYKIDALASIEKMKLSIQEKSKTEKRFKDEGDEVLKCTPGAERVLEIPDINIPHISDSTIKIENSSLSEIEGSIHFGSQSKGSDEIWQNLVDATEAELKTVASHGIDPKPLPTAKSFTKQVITKLDEEQQNNLFLAKSKRTPGRPEVRARMEPITISFIISNPLGFLVPISSMQLVARMKCGESGRIYTNVEAIDIHSNKGKANNNMKNWKFNCSNELFEVADFSRLFSTESQSWATPDDEGLEPFFVVSKKALALDGRSKRAVSLNICGLVDGDLEILGVRCKIFNEIWVYHQFLVPGPMLQNTSHNRGNRVRGESTLLKSKIECNMPNLSAVMIPTSSGKGRVLQGQVSEWTLRISNQGTAAADKITLKTNVPWINILDRGKAKINDEMAYKHETSHCVGPSGTLMLLPISDGSSNPNSTLLKPGQTVDIPIQIRTSGGGRQDFYMLFRYELFDMITSKLVPTKVRWLRQMFSVAVYPSLTMTASLIPSYGSGSDHILSVEMTNYRSDKQSDLDIFVNSISVASKLYKVKPLVPQNLSGSIEGTRSKIGHSIGWREQVTMHYLISPVNSTPFKCNLSECSLGTETVNHKNESRVTDFICLEYAHDKFKFAVDEHKKELARRDADKEGEPRSIAQIRRANAPASNSDNQPFSEDTSTESKRTRALTIINDSHPTSLDCLCSSEESSSEINIICTWATSGTEDSIVGQHHLRHLAVRPEYKSKGCPILISAKYDSDLSHDFSFGPLTIGMEISVRNRLVKSKVDFEFSLSHEPDFDFVGPQQFQWKLEGDEELIFPLEAVLFSNGIYDLQCVKITVCNEDGSKVPYVFPLQWIVKVNANRQ